MRILSGLILTALLWWAPTLSDDQDAHALTGLLAPSVGAPFAHISGIRRAKIVCGQTPEGYRCRNVPGAIRRGKMIKVPQSKGGSSGTGWSLFGGDSSEDPDALPPAPLPSDGAVPGTAGGTTPSACPPNSERLGGHCIAYSETCNRGMAAGAQPQICRSAQEKLVCDFRSDGLKDCCCRTYSQF